MNEEIKRFNIRVYGILINQNEEVLVSDEYLLDTFMTKFPGGGLEFGEGPEDCIKRECMEEFGQEVEIIRHFYTTGFFQKALFFPDNQLISIYYRIKLLSKPKFEIQSKAFAFREKTNGQQSFRWVKIKEFDPGELNFPIDKVVFELLKDCYL
ncbi:MAG: NUDIX domain-containing protein [Bacteroidales bacterium]|nr:NUDIX domain-containing protein [Bacteroidales bacterium]MCF8390567.1 NUDIX domain-containing protein [Bacteroidales bacterium]